MNRTDIFRDSRLALQVKRYHTWPVHHQQSVGEHTAQIMRIWYHIFGDLSPEVATHILWHDCGEIVTGDLPFPFKSQHDSIKAMIDHAEIAAVADMGGPPAYGEGELGQWDAKRLKLCDLIEMNEYGWFELLMGNRHAEPIVRDTHEHILTLQHGEPRLPDRDISAIIAYRAPRLHAWSSHAGFMQDF